MKISPFRKKSALFFFCFEKIATKSKGDRKKLSSRKKGLPQKKRRAKKGVKKSALFIFKGAKEKKKRRTTPFFGVRFFGALLSI